MRLPASLLVLQLVGEVEDELELAWCPVGDPEQVPPLQAARDAECTHKLGHSDQTLPATTRP